MNQAIYVKNNIINKLMFSINSLENVESQLKDFLNLDFIPKETLYTYINRREYLNDLFTALNSAEYKLVLLGGFQGTGKTQLIKSALLALEDNILDFYYEYNSSSNLDDIILSLYQYLDKELGKDEEYIRLKNDSTVKSIDKKLVSYLKNLNRPLLITIDGFENCINDELSISDKELSRFLNYLLSIPSIKLIISGSRISADSFNVDQEKIHQLKLSGLDESDAIRILNDHKLAGSENVLYQAFQTARGYPESLYLFITAVNILKLSPFDIIKEYSIHKENFEDFIVRKIYSKIPLLAKKALWFFATIRHCVNPDTIGRLNLGRDIDDHLKYLTSNKLLSFNNNAYCLKDFLRHFIYNNIPVNEKVKIHQFLYDFYTEQLSNKLENRIFAISRKSLNSEIHYHRLSSDKYKENSGSNHPDKYNSDPLVSSYSSKYDLNNLGSEIESAALVDVNVIAEQKIDTGKEEVKEEMLKEQKTGENTQTKSIDIGDLKIDLSDEEKKLLAQADDSEEVQDLQNNNYGQQPEEERIEQETPEQIRDKYIKNAVICKKKGNLSLTLSYYKKALNITEEIRDTVSSARVSKAIANIFEALKQYEKSLNYLNKTLDLYTRLNDTANIQLILLKIADMYKDNSKHNDALSYYNQILKYDPETIQDTTMMGVLSGLGDIYDYKEDLDVALRYYLEAFERAKKLNDTRNASILCFKIAIIYDDYDDFDRAIEYYQKNIQISNNPAVNSYLAASYSNMGALYEDMKDTNNAIINYAKSLEIDKLTNNYEGQCKNLSRLGNIYSGLDVKDKALAYFREGVLAAKSTSDLYTIAMSHIDIGDFYFIESQFENALRSFILAKKAVGKTISTDSKEKIDRRFKRIMSEIGEIKFNILIENIKRKYG
ncbi:MAG: hypothetical protein ACD_20C00397G0007 [uncultured bacterium]|nr:MAG: hypothetical protein ACD_20C00397G0007 [uncultured bacterium]HBH17748.1 hypothetical protein [Cyanobacteria bacterium UBA9579]